MEAARTLGAAGAIYHLHAKDVAIDGHNARVNGVLDTKSYGEVLQRSWVSRTCGDGHGDEFWKPFVSMLRAQGYEGVLSIEHEDSYLSLARGADAGGDVFQARGAVRVGGESVVVLIIGG